MLHVNRAPERLGTERAKYVRVHLPVTTDVHRPGNFLRAVTRQLFARRLVAVEVVPKFRAEEELLIAFAARVRTHSDTVLQHVQLYRARFTEGGATHRARHVAAGERVLDEVTLQLGGRLAQRVTQMTRVDVTWTDNSTLSTGHFRRTIYLHQLHSKSITSLNVLLQD